MGWVVERVAKCLGAWKGAVFSLGGRIHSCLSSIHTNYLSLSKLLLGVADGPEGSMRQFLWAWAKHGSVFVLKYFVNFLENGNVSVKF